MFTLTRRAALDDRRLATEQSKETVAPLRTTRSNATPDHNAPTKTEKRIELPPLTAPLHTARFTEEAREVEH